MIDTAQRIGDPATTNSDIVDEALKDMRVAIPAIVDSFNPATQTIECQIAIREKMIDDETGGRSDVNVSKLVDVPVVFPHSQGYALTMPLKPGDEVLVVFADTCINSWWASGGIGNQEEVRRHDLSDAIAIPGPVSQPKVIPNYNPDTIQMRNQAGDTYLEINQQIVNLIAAGAINITAGGQLTIVAPTTDITSITTHNGDITINGNLTINGNITVNGDATVSGTTSTNKLIIHGLDFDAHTHTYTQPEHAAGTGNTGTPQ